MKLTPMQSARKYAVRNFGVFWFTAISKASQNQILRAYIAGVRHGKNGSRK